MEIKKRERERKKQREIGGKFSTFISSQFVC